MKAPDPATAIVKDWWERLEIKPAGDRAFPNAVTSVRKVLKAGHDERVVRHAVMRIAPPISMGRIEMEINRGTALVTPVHDWKEGDQWSTR